MPSFEAAAHIYPEVLTPNTYQEGHCQLCSKSCPDELAQDIIIWVKKGSPAIFLLGIYFCPDCIVASKHTIFTNSSVVIETETLDEVFETLRQGPRSTEEPSLLSLESPSGPVTVSTYINYFSGHLSAWQVHQNKCCDVCQSETTQFFQKIYIGHYRPKRRYPEDPDIILFHFELCKSCYDKTRHLKEGCARFDWDIIDAMECEIRQSK